MARARRSIGPAGDYTISCEVDAAGGGGSTTVSGTFTVGGSGRQAIRSRARSTSSARSRLESLPRAKAVTDRRIHTRAPYSGTLHLQCAGDCIWFAVQAIDVSAGGFGFVSDVEMARGAFLVGIEFDEPPPAQLARCLGV